MSLSMSKIDQQIEVTPLTKIQAKQQFIDKTNELGLQHAFKFEEAWEFIEYKKKQKDFRKTVMQFEEAINNHENSLGKNLHTVNPTKHSFADGQYIREIHNPAGLILVTKIHAKTHPFFLMKGKMTIVTEEGVEEISAPYQGITKAGVKRVIQTHTDCVFITVHQTDKLSIEEIEEEVIASSFQELKLTVPDTKHIKRLIQEMN
tara:strand:+ start:88 stop:699 length:612 start_codon:yes stop_codon:yes gene_type:complete